MKLHIKSIINLDLYGTELILWQVRFNNCAKIFSKHEGAIEYANKVWKRYYKEQAALSMVNSISLNLLDVKEIEFIKKVKATKCAGISKAQYGYIKGIYERQEREF